MGGSKAKEKRGGIKQYQANKVDCAVASSPPRNLPTHELKKTAGKKRNQTYG